MPKARTGAISEPLTKTQLLSLLAEESGMTRRDVGTVMDELSRIVGRHLRKRGGSGQFTLPGLLKIKTIRKPATRARKGKNPFTGEEMMFKAKPARTVVKR
jgi:nucleoid DNA-binding protein